MNNTFTNTDAQNTEVMTLQRNDLATVDMLSQLTDPNGQFFCSIKDDGTRKSKIAIFNAVNGDSVNCRRFGGIRRRCVKLLKARVLCRRTHTENSAHGSYIS